MTTTRATTLSIALIGVAVSWFLDGNRDAYAEGLLRYAAVIAKAQPDWIVSFAAVGRHEGCLAAEHGTVRLGDCRSGREQHWIVRPIAQTNEREKPGGAKTTERPIGPPPSAHLAAHTYVPM